MNKTQTQIKPLEGFDRYNEIEICSNTMKKMNIFKYDNISPLLIGKGQRPLIWLTVRKPETFTWIYIVLKNTSYSNEIFVDISKEFITLIKDSNGKVLFEAQKISDFKVKINSIDLRPFGFNVFGENEELTVGQYKFTKSTLDSSEINFQTSLEDLYKTILNRFPAGREAAYLLNTIPPEPQIVKENLKRISLGGDSDHRYTDEYSKLDALNFLKVLEFVLNNPLPTVQNQK